MDTAGTPKLTTGQRRGAMRLAHVNAAVWGLGNGLVSTSLIVYLALELGAKGLAVSLILATPQLVGLLRMAAPGIIRLLGDRKRMCLAAYAASGPLLLILPACSAPGVLPGAAWSMAALVGLWSGYHLLEYLGTVALWSWLGDLVPRRIRGRFIGRRERWLTLARIAGMVTAGLFTYHWRETLFWREIWMGYAVLTAVGAVVLLVAVLPLVWLPRVALTDAAPSPAPLRQWLRPLRDERFRRLLWFGCWFSLFNGITQSAMFSYVANVLEIQLLWYLALQSLMRAGQSAAGPSVGRLADRRGNRPVLIVSQLLVAAGPLFYFAATPQMPWLFAGAWVVWIAYIGLNVGLPGLMLKLSPDGNSAPYVAAYFAVTGLCYGLSTIAGGQLFDTMDAGGWRLWIGIQWLDHYDLLFLFGWITRTLGVVWLLRLIEPRNSDRAGECFRPVGEVVTLRDPRGLRPEGVRREPHLPDTKETHHD